MQFDEYQKRAVTTAVYPKEFAVPYLTLGLAGEAAEVANKVKKIIRGDYNNDPDKLSEVKEAISKECGDVLWYLAVLIDELGVSFDSVAKDNLDKLAARADAGTLKGSGDDR